jgi:hypothetical protein
MITHEFARHLQRIFDLDYGDSRSAYKELKDRGLVTIDSDGEINLTDAGREALSAYDAEFVIVPRSIIHGFNIDTISERLDEISRAMSKGDWTELYMSIPARPDRDADIVCSRMAELLRELGSILAMPGKLAACTDEPPEFIVARRENIWTLRRIAEALQACGYLGMCACTVDNAIDLATETLGDKGPAETPRKDLVTISRESLKALRDAGRNAIDWGRCDDFEITEASISEASDALRIPEMPIDG